MFLVKVALSASETAQHQYLPLRKSIFNVIQGTVDKNAGVIPSTALDSNGFVNEALLLQILVGDGDGYIDTTQKRKR
jgi:hypothetical protein